jgi:hypothetical protein
MKNRELATETSEYLRDYVYLPIRDAFEFLFDNFIEQEYEKVELNKHIQVEGFIDTKIFDEIRSRSTNIIKIYEKQTIEQVDKIQNYWQENWAQQNEDFRTLTGESNNISRKLNDILESSISILRNEVTVVTQIIYAEFNSLYAELSALIQKNSRLIADAHLEARNQSRRQEITDLIILIISVAIAIFELIHYRTTIEVSNILIIVVFALLAVYMLSRLMTHQAMRGSLIVKIYENRLRIFSEKIRIQIESTELSIAKKLPEYNNKVKNKLLQNYDEIIKVASEANEEMLPRIDEQIKSSGQLARSTTKRITSIKNEAVSKIMADTDAYLDKVCEQMEGIIKQRFYAEIDDIAEEYISQLDKYIDLYRVKTKEISAISKEVDSQISDLSNIL